MDAVTMGSRVADGVVSVAAGAAAGRPHLEHAADDLMGAMEGFTVRDASRDWLGRVKEATLVPQEPQLAKLQRAGESARAAIAALDSITATPVGAEAADISSARYTARGVELLARDIHGELRSALARGADFRLRANASPSYGPESGVFGWDSDAGSLSATVQVSSGSILKAPSYQVGLHGSAGKLPSALGALDRLVDPTIGVAPRAPIGAKLPAPVNQYP